MTWVDVDGAFGDPLGTKMFYDEVFGEDKVKVLELVTPDKVGIIYRFTCAIPGTEHACQALKKLIRPPASRNKSMILPLNEDLIAVRSRLFFPSSEFVMRKKWKCDIPGRHIAGLAIKKKIEEETNLSVTDAIVEIVPHDCLTSRQFALLVSRTHDSDIAMASEPRSLEQIEEEVSKNSAKFCSVNGTAVMEMESWERYFKSTDYLVNCEDGVTNAWLQRDIAAKK